METGTTPSCLATRRSEWILFLRGPLGGNVTDHCVADEVAAHHPDDAIEVFHRCELERQLAFSLTKVDPHTGIKTVREPGGLAIQLRVVGASTWLAGAWSLVIPDGNDLLDISYRQTLGRDPLCQALHGVKVRKSE